MKKNHVIFYMQQVMACCANILITGSVIQTFLMESGCTEGQVSAYVSVMQVMQVATMLLLSGKMEKIKNIFHCIAGSYVMQIPMLFIMLFLSIKYQAPVDKKYMIIFVVSLIVSVFQGIHNVMAYKLPYYIIDMREYGKVMGISGVIIGIAGVSFAGILSFCISKYPYFRVMALFSGIGILFTTATAVFTESFQAIPEGIRQKEGQKINIFTYKPFYQLLIPNLFRGISNGIFTLTAVVGYFCDVIDSTGAGMLVTLAQTATMVGCFLYSMLDGRIKDGTLTMLSSIAFCLLLPFMLLGNSQKLFLIVYFVVYLFYNFVNYAIPVLVVRNIDYGCIGQYSAWRMALHTVGTAIGSAMVPVLLRFIRGAGCLIACGVLLLICGVCYYRFERGS